MRVTCCANEVVGEDGERSARGGDPVADGQRLVAQTIRLGSRVGVVGSVGDVVVAGVRDHLEIWDGAAWRKELEEVEGSAEDVAERLATKRD